MRPDRLGKLVDLTGNFVAPTVPADLEQLMTSVQEEIFAPVLLVIPYDTLDSALQMVNGSRYDLTSSTSGMGDGSDPVDRRRHGLG